jgi:hypothetical protein
MGGNSIFYLSSLRAAIKSKKIHKYQLYMHKDLFSSIYVTSKCDTFLHQLTVRVSLYRFPQLLQCVRTNFLSREDHGGALSAKQNNSQLPSPDF